MTWWRRSRISSNCWAMVWRSLASVWRRRFSSPVTGAYALGPEAGEWLQQATLAIRGHLPHVTLRDVVQPFPTCAQVYVAVRRR